MLNATERQFISEIVHTYEREHRDDLSSRPWTPAEVIIGIVIGAELDPDVRIGHCAAYLRALSREELLGLFLGN